MNKKRIIILMSVFLLALVPITVFATMNIGVMVDKVLTKEEFNKQREEEKQNWINSHNIDSLKNSSVNNNVQIDKELIDSYAIKEEKINENEKTMEEIINRFYKEDYKELSKKMVENADKMSLNKLYEQDYVIKIFEIILDIIENKNIKDTEKDILKEFLMEQSYFIKDNTEIKTKINKVLNDN